MTKAINVMVDLETMGTRSDSAILSIGAVEFTLSNNPILGKRFYQVIDLKSSFLFGRIYPDTVMWWLQQSQSARDSILDESKVGLPEGLRYFAQWIKSLSCMDITHDGETQDVCIWGNGAATDNVILDYAYKQCGGKPWSHKNDRCYRTIKAQFPKIEKSNSGTHHHALDDAINQATYLINLSKIHDLSHFDVL